MKSSVFEFSVNQNATEIKSLPTPATDRNGSDKYSAGIEICKPKLPEILLEAVSNLPSKHSGRVVRNYSNGCLIDQQ
jgi:hypothetical protein